MKKLILFLTVATGLLATSVVFTACGSDEDTPFLLVDKSELAFTDGKTTETVTISSNVTWEIMGIPSWISSLTPKQGNGNATITIVVSGIEDGKSRSAILTVSGNGVVKTINVSQKGKDVTIPDDHAPSGVQAIDMGTSVKWASFNLGSTSITGFGSYFCWGSMGHPSDYNGSSITLENIKGTSYDAAHVNWGGTWRMPTNEEFQELIDKCSFLWTTQSGVAGCKITASNGNAIFLPAAGVMEMPSSSSVTGKSQNCFYWTASSVGDDPLCFGFDSSMEKGFVAFIGGKYFGCSIRPVKD